MGFFDNARDALSTGLDKIDEKSQELESMARIKDLEMKRSGTYAKLGERFAAMAENDPSLKDTAPELFAQIAQYNSEIQSLKDAQSNLGAQIDEAERAREAEKARRDQEEAAEKARAAAEAANAAAAAGAAAGGAAGAGAAAGGAAGAGGADVGKTCPSCGHAVKDGDKFCPECGAAVK